MSCSLRSRCLEVMGIRKNGCARETGKGRGSACLRGREYRFYLVSESREDSCWLRGSRGDKCFP